MNTIRAAAPVVALLAVALISACSSLNPYLDPAKPHHTERGFKNNYIERIDKGFSELVRWQIQRRQEGLPPPPQLPTPVQAPDLAAIAGYAAKLSTELDPMAKPPLITWIGHASMLVQAGGLNVLTDPIFSERASPVQFMGPKRAQAPGLTLADLPPIDVVLISHNHYDHLDKASVQALAQRASADRPTLFMVPLGLKPWFASMGIRNTLELDWWDKHVLRGVEFVFTPVQHWSARGLGDRSETLWGGFAVFAPDLHWYFSGDTGYSRDFADTAARFADRLVPERGGGFDLALIAVGGYEPRWFMGKQHVNPDEAVMIHRDLRAKRSVGIHWGTFELTDEPLDQAPKDLALARHASGLSAADFSVMAIGETRALPMRRVP